MRDVAPNMSDYDEARRDFKLDVPEYFNFGFDVVDRWAEDRTKLALISVDSAGEQSQKHTFWDMKVLSNLFANLLRRLGVGKGDGIDHLRRVRPDGDGPPGSQLPVFAPQARLFGQAHARL